MLKHIFLSKYTKKNFPFFCPFNDLCEEKKGSTYIPRTLQDEDLANKS